MRYIIGADEVGRGCLAGPVHVCGAAFPSDMPHIQGVRDSKQLSPHGREKMFKILRGTAGAYWQIASRTPDQIESLGINIAVKECFLEVTERLLKTLQTEGHGVDAIRIDGPSLWPPNRFQVPTEFIIKGDDTDWVIGAASIVAKVTRDALMDELAAQHPGYGWERNKGYGTAEHTAAIRQRGLTPLHRPKFCRAFGAVSLPRKPQVFVDEGVNVFDLFGED